MPKPLAKSVSLIGVGRVGTALAVALTDAGYSLDLLLSRTPSNAEKRLKKLGLNPRVKPANNIEALKTDTVIIATPDDQIGSVAKSLSDLEANNTSRHARVVLHTSGALASTALTPMAAKGWKTGSLHPLVAVGNLKIRKNIFRGAYWCVEGDPAALKVARRLVRDLEGKAFSVTAERKSLYHAAAVMAAGNLVALLSVATDLLVQCGIEEGLARRILEPLASSAFHNFANDPKQALTGPFARGDVATVSLHLQALRNANINESRELYTLLGLRSLELAEEMGLERDKVRAIQKILE